MRTQARPLAALSLTVATALAVSACGGSEDSTAEVSSNSGQVTGSISVVELSFIVHEPSGIMPRSRAKSRSESRRR